MARQRGFTLIELLVVIVIIATLAAIVTPTLVKKSEEAKIGAAKGQIASFEAALDQFALDCGRYPTADEGLEALRTPPASLAKWNGPYERHEIPLDPWEHPYVYKSPGAHAAGAAASFDLSSNGPDGAAGTADDIENWNLSKSAR